MAYIAFGLFFILYNDLWNINGESLKFWYFCNDLENGDFLSNLWSRSFLLNSSLEFYGYSIINCLNNCIPSQSQDKNRPFSPAVYIENWPTNISRILLTRTGDRTLNFLYCIIRIQALRQFKTSLLKCLAKPNLLS